MDAFAVWMPNDNIVGESWKDYKISISQLEGFLNAPNTILHYDFLNTNRIDESVKDQLKDLNANSSVRPPLPGFQAYLSTVSDGAVWHTGVHEDGSIENSSINSGAVEVGVTQVGSTEVGAFQRGSIQIRSMQDGIAEISARQGSSIEAGIPQNSPFEVRTTWASESKSGFSQISSAEVDVRHTGSKEISAPDYRIAEVSSIQNRLRNINFSQVGISQASINQVGSSNLRTMQVDPAQIRSAEMNLNMLAISHNLGWQDAHTEEVPLPERVSVQQFLNFDSLSSRAHAVTVDRIGASVPSLWDALLSTNTPFDLKLAVDALPEGWLAEARVTRFDAQGRPMGGTITIDNDANGAGWFIDSTPWDFSEFGQVLSPDAFRATSGSEAFGRYDLYTTILNEFAHLVGFISGWSGFDSYIQYQVPIRN